MPKTKPGKQLPSSTNHFGNKRVSVVITVFNEEESITKLVDSLKSQSVLPQEVVIVDGGSKDNTFTILNKLSSGWKLLKVYRYPGNRSVGRNFGVTKTSGSIIAFTDAGCFPEDNWLEKLVEPFSDQSVNIVSGYYTGIYKNIFQKSLIPFVLVMPDKLSGIEFYPSSRSMALRRAVWNESGGFDVNLWHNEDYAYAHWLKKLGYNFYFAKDAIVNWIPRSNLSSAFWMFLRFALGDIQAGIYRPQLKKLFIRLAIFLITIAFTIEIRSFSTLIIILLFIYSIWAIKKNFKYVKDIRAFMWLPILQLTVDTAVLFGSLIGILSKK